MATVDKTFAFASDAEGLTDQGQSGVVFAWLSSDGTPASGCVRFTQAAKSVTHTESAVQTGKTWEDWGVPAGATVTHMQLLFFNEKLAANTKLSSHTLTINVRDGNVGGYVGSGPLYSASPGTTVDASWQNVGAGAQQTIDADQQASNAPANLYIEYTVTTSGGGGSANVEQRIDNIGVRITYTESAPEQFASVTFPLGLAIDTAALREALAAITFPLGYDTAVAASRETFGSVTLPLGLEIFVNATTITEHFASVTMPLGLTVDAAGTRETFGAVTLPITVDIQTAMTRETFAAVSNSLLLAIVTAAHREIFGALTYPLLLDITVNAIIEGQLTLTTIKYRTLLGVG